MNTMLKPTPGIFTWCVFSSYPCSFFSFSSVFYDYCSSFYPGSEDVVEGDEFSSKIVYGCYKMDSFRSMKVIYTDGFVETLGRSNDTSIKVQW